MNKIKWQEEKEAFFKRNKKNLVRYPKAPEGEAFPGYLWDDVNKVRNHLINEHGEKDGAKYCYTIVTGDDDCAYIMSGWKRVNRIAWLVSKEPVEKDIEIRYW